MGGWYFALVITHVEKQKNTKKDGNMLLNVPLIRR